VSIYLIRHTTPLIEKGLCYGQADIEVTESFHTEAELIKPLIPATIEAVYSSPLVRCRKLAEHLFPGQAIIFENDLMEIHCGEWELRNWDAIPRQEIDPWMHDFVNVQIPGGESYIQLYNRVISCFEKITDTQRPVAIVSHGGVLRSILSHITNTPLGDSFGVFGLSYGCVVKVDRQEGALRHELLTERVSGKEQHKPSYFKK
jgi:alpha-ribazole phosphatase